MTAGVNERALIRKIALHTLPLIMLAYFVAMVDRANISFAAKTMNADLGFSETIYGFGASAFFLGYSLLEVPSNLMLARFGARVWLARIMFTWGVISILTAFIHTPAQFYVMRFALGVAEAGFYPGVILYVSTWFPGEHRARSISRFNIAVPVSYVVLGSLAAPLLALDGLHGLRGWQWLLIVEGMPSVLLAIVLLAALPDSPASAGWMKEEERQWLADALAQEASTDHVPGGLLRAILNPYVLLMGCANGLNYIAINAIVFSAPRLLAPAAGNDAAVVGRIISSGGLGLAVALIVISVLAGRTVQRTLVTFAGFMAMSGLGLSLLWLGGTGMTAIAGYMLFIAASTAAGTLPLAVVSRLIPEADRPAGLAMGNTISQGGSFCGPLMFGVAADWTHSFQLGVALLIPFAFGSAMVALLVRARTLRTD